MIKYIQTKTVTAAQIVGVQHEKLPEFKNPVCRGAAILGTACGHCERCVYYQKDPHPYGMATYLKIEGSGFPVTVYSADFQTMPVVGDYYVAEEGGKPYAMTKTEFESRFQQLQEPAPVVEVGDGK